MTLAEQHLAKVAELIDTPTTDDDIRGIDLVIEHLSEVGIDYDITDQIDPSNRGDKFVLCDGSALAINDGDRFTPVSALDADTVSALIES